MRLGALVVSIVLAGLAHRRRPGGCLPSSEARTALPWLPAWVAQSIKIKSPAASQVFQRDANGRAEIPIVLDDSVQGRPPSWTLVVNRG